MCYFITNSEFVHKGATEGRDHSLRYQQHQLQTPEKKKSRTCVSALNNLSKAIAFKCSCTSVIIIQINDMPVFRSFSCLRSEIFITFNLILLLLEANISRKEKGPGTSRLTYQLEIFLCFFFKKRTYVSLNSVLVFVTLYEARKSESRRRSIPPCHNKAHRQMDVGGAGWQRQL